MYLLRKDLLFENTNKNCKLSYTHIHVGCSQWSKAHTHLHTAYTPHQVLSLANSWMYHWVSLHCSKWNRSRFYIFYSTQYETVGRCHKVHGMHTDFIAFSMKTNEQKYAQKEMILIVCSRTTTFRIHMTMIALSIQLTTLCMCARLLSRLLCLSFHDSKLNLLDRHMCHTYRRGSHGSRVPWNNPEIGTKIMLSESSGPKGTNPNYLQFFGLVPWVPLPVWPCLLWHN